MEKQAIEHLQSEHAASKYNSSSRSEKTDTIALPSGTGLLSLEKYRPHRSRFRGTFRTTSIDDFAQYCAHAPAQHMPRCFVDPTSMSATTVFNFGDATEPGHGDHKAKLGLEKTAPYEALLATDGGDMKSQRGIAEWLEDWRHYLTATDSEGAPIELKKAIQVVRSISIESEQKSGHEEGDFKSRRTAMESITARSDAGALPSFITFTTEPYSGLSERSFAMRLSMLTAGKELLFTLRIVRHEEAIEEMAQEFKAKLIDKLTDAKEGPALPVVVGTMEL